MQMFNQRLPLPRLLRARCRRPRLPPRSWPVSWTPTRPFSTTCSNCLPVDGGKRFSSPPLQFPRLLQMLQCTPTTRRLTIYRRRLKIRAHLFPLLSLSLPCLCCSVLVLNVDYSRVDRYIPFFFIVSRITFKGFCSSSHINPHQSIAYPCSPCAGYPSRLRLTSLSHGAARAATSEICGRAGLQFLAKFHLFHLDVATNELVDVGDDNSALDVKDCSSS